MYPGIGKDILMIIIGGLGWDLTKELGGQMKPYLPGLIPPIDPTPPVRDLPWEATFTQIMIILGVVQVLPLPAQTRWFWT